MHHHQKARKQAEPEQQIDRLLQPPEQAIHASPNM
jgi:hypothetical protein